MLEAGDVLGECPCWHPAEAALYWVDIKGRTLHRYEPATRAERAWPLAHGPSAIAPRTGGGLVMAAGLQLGVFYPTSGVFDARIALDEPANNRTNDGRVGADGRFWFGVMDDAGERRTGAVFRLEKDWRCTRVLSGMGIPNAVTTNGDATTLYVADSADRLLYAYDLDSTTGALGDRRVFAHPAPPQTPDGAALDAEDHLWNAHWDGARLVRYAPDGAAVDALELPVSRPTSCAFGDSDLMTLYITSARVGLDDAALAREPLAGALFAARLGIPGAPQTLFDG